MPAPFADARSAVRIGQPRPIDAEMFTPIDLERAIVATRLMAKPPPAVLRQIEQ